MKRSLLIIAYILLLAFTAGDNRSGYNVPLAAYSLCAGDLDLDGDIDIICGHNYNWQTQWSGISILENIGEGYFNLIDLIYIYGGQISVSVANIKGDENPEIIGQYYDGQQNNAAIVEINNGNYDITYFPMCDNLTLYSVGDISGNNSIDIVFISNDYFLWGIIYNDGTGNFSEPEYFNLSFHPIDISCGDLNNDGREDIVITGQNTEVYFSYPDGFQLSILSTEYISCSEISDFNNDGMNDILTSYSWYPSNFTKLIFYENTGNNTFINYEPFIFEPICSAHIVISDFDNDSLPDILFNTRNETDLIIFYNLGDFQLSEPQFIPMENYGEYSRKSKCADFDGNGFNDIATIRYLHATLPANLNIFFNDGKGNFVEDPVGIIESPNSKLQTRNLHCYPNPFKTETTFEYEIKENAYVELSVFNLSGELIEILINKQQKACLPQNGQNNGRQGGTHLIKWSGLDKNKQSCKPGSYIAYLKVNGKVLQSIKLIKK